MDEVIKLGELFMTFCSLPFVNALAHQKYLIAEKSIIEAVQSHCTHWYLDGSLYEDMVDKWNDIRVQQLKDMIITHNCKPIFHGNFKAPLASDVLNFSEAAISYVKKEIDLCSKINAPLIIHAGAIVEPRAVLRAKKVGLQNYARAVKILSEYASLKNVTLLLENLSNYKNNRPFHYLFTNYEEYEYIFTQIEKCNISNVFLFFDVGHSNVGNQDTTKVFTDFNYYIKGISLSNNDGSKDQHREIMTGSLNYYELVEAILKTRWYGLVAFETRGINTRNALSQLEIIYNELTCSIA